MQDVFISYSTQNAPEAEALRSILTDAGIPVWMAPDSLPAGIRYMQAIADAIDNCCAMVVLASSESQKSEQVEREVNLMISDYPKKLLCALIIDGNPLKGWMRLVLLNRQIETAEQIRAGDRGTDRLLTSLMKLYQVGNAASGSQIVREPSAKSISPQFTGLGGDFEIRNGVLVRYIGKGGIARIPKGVTRIGTAAFKDRTDVTAVMFPVTLTEIGRCAFHGCMGLTEIALPQNLSVLTDYAFLGCTSLQKVRFTKTPSVIGDGVFEGCSALTDVEFPLGFKIACDMDKLTIGKGVFLGTPIEDQHHGFTSYFE